MSGEHIEVLETKLDILIDDFRDFKRLVYRVIGWTIVFVVTSGFTLTLMLVSNHKVI